MESNKPQDEELRKRKRSPSPEHSSSSSSTASSQENKSTDVLKRKEDTVFEEEPVRIVDDKYIIRAIKLRSADPYCYEMTLDKGVRQGKIGIIRVAVSRCNDIREREERLPPLAITVANDSQDPHLLIIKAQDKEKSQEDFHLFFSLLAKKGYLSRTTATAALSLIMAGKATPLLERARPSSPDQSSSGFFAKRLKKLNPREDKSIITSRIIEKEGEDEYEYTVSEKEAARVADDEYIIRTLKLSSTTPYSFEMTLDERVRRGKVGLIYVALSRYNDVRERVQGLPPIAISVVNDSQNLYVLKVTAENKEKSQENLGLFFSLLVKEKHLSESTASTALSLMLRKGAESLEQSSAPPSPS